MSLYQRTIAARERARKIRSTRESVLSKTIRRESEHAIYNALKFGRMEVL